MLHQPPPGTEPSPGTDDVTLAEDLRLLADEAKVLAKAELGFQKARAAYAGQQVKKIVALLVIGLVLLFFAAMAAVVGLVIALGQVIGVWGAMAVVTLGLAVLAGLCAMNAKRKLGAMKRVIANTTSEEARP
ncbi:phage holin family protein [Novosphingobium decolorationis]|uniref:Phage holin family protein n=1 Tax=Novosphingobium decolorationis TaxID=2698673 RepID=A0ABX8E052_9SPHN|nr:phage holin family protein [Novosphingobium decolorationis]QVM82502.1 phage holin family protein [Novosphingobium decolorationis]